MAPEPRPRAELESFRRELRQLDRELLALYARRRRAVRDLWEYKRREGLALRDPPQEDRVLRQAREVAGDEGIPPAEAEAFMRWLLRSCRRAAGSPTPGGGSTGNEDRVVGRASTESADGPVVVGFVEGSYVVPASEGHAAAPPERRRPPRPAGQRSEAPRSARRSHPVGPGRAPLAP